MDRPSNKKDILTPTDKVTSAGRKLYKTSDGDFVSEKTTTVQNPNNNLWYNIPTINNGRKMSVDKAAELYLGSSEVKDVETGRVIPSFKTVEEAVKAAKTRSQSLSRGQKLMNNQMKQFEKGGEVDPVSGNNVPLGSTAKEVRDDQPAMLSEGEMVVPADVVRYFGVEFFMKLRDEAKMGFKKMEAMGQFGTDEGQTLPDDTLFNAGGPPFTIEDIEVIEPDDIEEETLEANVGAFVQGGQGTDPFNQPTGTATSTTLANASKDPQGFLQSLGNRAFGTDDIIKSIGDVNFNYLSALAPKGADFSGVTDSGKKVLDDYFTDFSNKLSASVQSPTTVEEEGSEDQDTGPTAGQGIGSMSELASAPTAANIQAAKDFSEYPSSLIGVMDGLISAALNPFGNMLGPPGVAGMVGRGLSSVFSKGLSVGLPFGIGPQISLTDPIGKGKGSIDKIATKDQVVAKAITTAANNTNPKDLELMSIVGIAEQIGFDVNAIANDPNVGLVSVANDPLGIGIATQAVGPLGGVTLANGDILGFPDITTTHSPADLTKGKALQQNFVQEIKTRARGFDELGAAGITDEVEDEDDLASIDDPGFDQNATTAPDVDPTNPDDDAQADAEAAAAEAQAAAEAASMGGGPQSAEEAEGEGGQDGEGGEDSGPEGIAKGGLIKRKK